MSDENPNKKYSEYFVTGKMDNLFLAEWIAKPDGEASRPNKIIDEREGDFFLKLGGLV
jgi:hypothetical protein